MEPDISVVALNYNTRDLLRACLYSVLECTGELELELIVVDNASRDGSALMVGEEFPDVKLIANDRNLGYARGTNAGIRASSAPYVLLLKPETVVSGRALRLMRDYLEAHPEVAMVGPRLVDGDGVHQQSCHYFTVLAWKHALRYLLVLLGGPGSSVFGLSTDPGDKGNGPVEVDWVYGACALVRREVLDDVGMLDENIFLYGEDMDLCFRMARAGWKTVYLPQAEIIHYGNQSCKHVYGETRSLRRARARIEVIDYFQRKHFGAAHSYIIRALMCGGSLAAAASLGSLYLFGGRDPDTGARSVYAAKVAVACLESMLFKPGAPRAAVEGRSYICGRWS